MTTFNGSGGNDIANAALGELSGFTGGTAAQLQDLIGDLIFGFDGDDFIFAGNGNDDIEGWEGHDVINGGAGNDEIWAMQISNVDGSLIGDEINGNDGSDTLLGSGGGDSIDGGADGDLIFGNSGDDFIQGGAGSDNLFGGDGNDTIYAYDFIGSVEGSGVFDKIDGGAGNDVITGSNRKDFITGGAGIDVLLGGSGSDEFYFASGDLAAGEIIDGGEGTDVLLWYGGAPVYDFRSASVISVDFVLFDYSQLGASVMAIFDAAQIKSQGAAFGVISGGQAVLRIEMAGETFIDMSQFNLFSTWDADDRVEVNGGLGSDTMIGTSEIDHLSGNGGNDILDGGGGADLMSGGAQNDRYRTDDAGDVIVEAEDEGNDTVITSLQTVTLGSNVERLVYSGSDAFTGRGNGLDNRISGGSGGDTLIGGRGEDVLTGRQGGDHLSGGGGGDSYLYFGISDSRARNPDHIAGFQSGIDVIDVSALDARMTSETDNAFKFIGGAAFSAEGQIRAVQAGADTILQFNVQGSGGTDMTIHLNGTAASALSAADFIL